MSRFRVPEQRRIAIARIRVPSVKTGVIFRAKPHFIAPARPEKNLEMAPGFYVEPEDTRYVYTAYLKKLNLAEFEEDDEVKLKKKLLNIQFEVIVRETGNRRPDDGTSTAYLERILHEGDYVHVEFNSHKATDTNTMIGKFQSYDVYSPVRFQYNGVESTLTPQSCAFGMIKRVNEFHTKCDFLPIEIVSEERYESSKNIIERI